MHSSSRGSAAYLAISATQRILTFATLPILTAAISPAAYGQVALLLTIHGLALLLLPVGLETPVLRAVFAHDDLESRNRHLSTLAVTLFVGPVALAFIGAVALLAVPPLFGIRPIYLATYFLAAGVFTSATVYLRALFRAEERFRAYAILMLSFAISQTSLRLLLVIGCSLGVAGWVLADFFSAVFMLFLALTWQHRYLIPSNFDRRVLKSDLQLGLPLVPHAGAHWGLNLSDRLVLAAYTNTALVGIYSIAYQIASVAALGITEINRAFMPRYGEAIRDGDASQRLHRHIGVQLVLGIGLCALVALLGPQVVHLLFHDEYADAARLIPWMCLGFAFLSVYYIPINFLSIVVGYTRGIWLLTTAAAALNLILNILLIPHFGAVAAAINSAVGYALLFILTVSLARRKTLSFPVNPMRLLIPLTVAVIPTAVASTISVEPGPAPLVTGLLAALGVALLLVRVARSGLYA